MQRPPRDTRRALFGKNDVLHACLQGLGLSMAIALTLLGFSGFGHGPMDTAQARSLVLLVLVMGSSALVYMGSKQRWCRWHPVAWVLGVGSLTLLVLLLEWPRTAKALDLVSLPPIAWAVAASACIGCMGLLSGLSWILQSFKDKGSGRHRPR